MKSENKSVFVIVLIVSGIALFGIVCGIFFPQVFNRGASQYRFVEIPTVKASLVSADGEIHNVSANISLELDKSAKNFNANSLEQQITDIMSSLDYDKITDTGSVEYIRAQVQEKLSENISADQIKGIYITSLHSGDNQLYSQPAGSSSGSRRSNVLKGLFHNLK